MLFFIILLFKKNKKNNIHDHDIAFHNYKIKCIQKQTPVLLHSKMTTSNLDWLALAQNLLLNLLILHVI